MVPVVMLLLLGMLEFGFVFTHQLGLEYATREGARMGAALGSGTNQVPCADVDKNTIAALQRVLTSSGSQVSPARVTEIRIYAADSSGAQIGSLVNRWVPGIGPTVDGQALAFTPSSTGWSACSRVRSWTRPNVPPDSVGVSLVYDYQFVTPLASLMGVFGSGRLTITDRTVMALNPT